MATAAPTVFIEALWPRQSASTMRNVILVVAGSAFIALCAHIKVPGPIPMTMQTFAVLLIGLAYGARLAMMTVALYLLEGLMGLPVFAGGAGPAYFMGQTGGYLIGFWFAAAATGLLAQAGWGRPIVQVFVAMLVGSAIIYFFGAAWLAFGWQLGVQKAVALGVLPFLPADLVKAALAAACLPIAWKLVGR